ncbi:MAG: PIN domain-containing protein [Ignavibacteria bacterium]|nr:PIN domain-containing protein [Ignavibacteria bacterium]MBK6875130.1 PIN domain-containing protein [Ignavibacteria bacterium]MBK9228290.1 PIN domain-containing protein [Ignavibacteria bacterium]
MKKVFVDTDICLDLLSGRKPFNSVAEKLFSLADTGKIRTCVSSLSFANIDYILKSQYSAPNSRQIIAKFKTLVTVLPVDSKTIDLAIASDFADFEDAIQYYSAIENGIDLMLTRNIRDYKKATIKVMTPETFLSKPR